MWPFRRTKAPRVESIRLADVSTDVADYPVLTVGQSRLGESFQALGFIEGASALFVMATLVPMTDPGLKTIADIEIRVEGNIVGYLRPPALTTAMAALDSHHAATIEVPIMIVTTPAGPEVRVHASLNPRPVTD